MMVSRTRTLTWTAEICDARDMKEPKAHSWAFLARRRCAAASSRCRAWRLVTLVGSSLPIAVSSSKALALSASTFSERVKRRRPLASAK